jgi:hypothetical protein
MYHEAIKLKEKKREKKKKKTSLAINEVKIKTTLRFHRTQVRRAVFKRNDKRT